MKELTCIVCPRGCRLKVDEENNFKVSGNSCPKGEEYGKRELVNPTRVLTGIVRVEGSPVCCSVKTDKGVPKKDIFKAMDALKKVTLKLPIKIGDIAVKNILGEDINWVATKNMD